MKKIKTFNENKTQNSTYDLLKKNVEDKIRLDVKIGAYLDMKEIHFDDEFYYYDLYEDVLTVILDEDENHISITKKDFDDYCENPDKYKKRRGFNL